jgi:hypothetical protein
MRAGKHCISNKPTLQRIMAASVRRLLLGKLFIRGSQYHHRNITPLDSGRNQDYTSFFIGGCF